MTTSGAFCFYLGTHRSSWLATAGVPLFVSRRVMPKRKFPRAIAPWGADSGGFTELSIHGRWQTTAKQWITEARRFRDEVGSLSFAAIQDWMCEPVMLQKTGRTVAEHQRLTVDSLAELLDAAPDVPWLPVLQGWRANDYLRHVEMYDARGFSLKAFATVGIGSVCRRQHTGEAEDIIRTIAGTGIRLHGFGFKTLGLRNVWEVLASSDSMAWSVNARKHPPMGGHTHKSCANCLPYALRWREEMLAGLTPQKQLRLFSREAA